MACAAVSSRLLQAETSEGEGMGSRKAGRLKRAGCMTHRSRFRRLKRPVEEKEEGGKMCWKWEGQVRNQAFPTRHRQHARNDVVCRGERLDWRVDAWQNGGGFNWITVPRAVSSACI